jgi:uncharacterized protein YggE
MARMTTGPFHGIVCDGSATISAPPDMALIRVGVGVTDALAARAFQLATDALGRLRERVRAFDVPDADVSESRLNLTTHWEQGEPRGYACDAALTVHVARLELTRPLLVALTEAGANRVDGVAYDVADARPLHDQARRDAVADALHKAECYARAAGVRIGAVRSITATSQDPAPRRFAAMAAGGGGGSSDLTPGVVTFRADVTMALDIIQP